MIAFALALLLALADWVAVARGSKRFEYVFKPATVVAVIAAALIITQGPHDGWQAQWFIPGLGLSLAGDVFLMLPGTRWFLFGLGAFLLAHLAYIVGLNPTLPPLASVAVLVPVLLAGVLAAAAPVRALRARHASSIAPVILYAVAISLMLYSAWATLFRPEWSAIRRALVIAGATLFFVSDALLARNRFVGAFPHARVATMITYHLGQMALAASMAN